MLLALVACFVCIAPQAPPKKPAAPKPAVPAPAAPKPAAPAPELVVPAVRNPEALVPANAFAIVRAKSADDLVRVLDPWVQAGLAPSFAQDPTAILGAICTPDAPWPLVDRKQPLAIALCPGEPLPRIVLILPCTDAARMVADDKLRRAGWTCSASGAYVTIAQAGKSAKEAPGTPPLLDGLDASDVVARFFGKSALTQYGDVLHDTLAEAFGAGGPAADLFDTTVAALWAAIESFELLDVRLTTRADYAKVDLLLLAREGSAMAQVKKLDATGLESAVKAIDPAAGLEALLLVDLRPLSEWGAAALGRAAAELDALVTEPGPEKQAVALLRSRMEGVMLEMKKTAELYAEQGPLVAFSFDYTQREGMRICQATRPADPDKCIRALMDSFRPRLGLKVSAAPENVTLDGIDVARFRIDPDIDAILAQDDAPKISRADMKAGAEAGWRALFGKQGCVVSCARRGPILVTTLGPDSALKAAVARTDAEVVDAYARALVQGIGNLNPGFALLLDPASLFEQCSALAEIFEPELDFRDRTNMTDIGVRMRGTAPIFLAGGVHGRVWRLSFGADVARMADALRGPSPEMVALRKRVRGELESLVDVLDAYADNNGGFPAALDLLAKPDAKGLTYFLDDKVPLDPWGRAYLYEAPKTRRTMPRLSTLGADGKPGGTGADADLELSDLMKDRR